MKKIAFLTAVSFLSLNLFSQLKIGNNPTTINSNSILELESTNKGLLIPRIALTSMSSASPLSAFVAGMMVYNTATTGDLTPGFYVSNGTSWSKIDNQTSTTLYNGNGTLSGNRTITQGTNTLTFTSTATNGFSVDGTTFSVDAANNRIGIGTATPAQTLDVVGTARFDGGALIQSFTNGTWINLPTTGPSGIGSGGSGSNAWIAYAQSNGQWFNDAAAGDIAYRNTGGKLLWGNNSTAAAMAMSNDRLGIGILSPAEKLHVVGNIRSSSLAGTGYRMVVADANGTMSTTAIPISTTYDGSTSVALNGTSFERAALTGDVTATANSNATIIATDAVTSAKILNGTIVEADLANDAISYAKLQNVSTNNRLLGRGTTGAGDAEEITVGLGLTLTGTTLTAIGGSTLYSADGTLAGNRTVTQGANTLTFTSSLTNGFSVDGTTFSVDAANNRVGIGTTSPRGALDVAGTTGWTYFQNSSYGIGNPTIARGLMYAWNNSGGQGESELLFGTGEGSIPSFYINSWDGTTKTPRLVINKDGDFNLNGSTFSVDAVNNKVGVGTSSPTQSLDVNGGIIARNGGTSLAGSGNEQLLFGYAGTSTYRHAIRTRHNDGNITNNAIDFYTWSNADAISGLPTLLNLSMNGGKIGIGTASPSEKLDVSGNIRFSGAIMPNNLPGTSGQVLTSAGAGAAPTWSTPSSAVNIYNSDGTLTGNRTVTQGANNLTFSGSGTFRINGSSTAQSFSMGGAGIFGIDASGIVNGRFSVLENGNVGIGVASPSQKLDVDGGILARGNNAVSNQGAYLHWNRSGGDGETYILNQKGLAGSNAGIRFGSVTTGNTHTEWARFVDNGSFSVDGSTFSVDAANNRIGIGTSSPNSSSIVEMASTTQGFLPPRLTSAQRDAISSPAAGLVIYNTNTNCLNFYAGNAWFETCGSVVPTAVVSSLNCGSATATGYIYSGTLASGVSISVPYSGGNGGIYSPQSISSTGVLGLTASLSIGNLVSGSGSLVFTISGTPAASGTATFPLSMAGQSCSFSLSTIPYTPGSVFCSGGPAAVVDVTNPTTGKTWMDRNLGATQKATSSTDANSYGDLYQGGRRSDGHQCRNSTTTSTQSSSDVPPHGNFITSSATSDWHAQNDNLWQGVNGINNPCPTGYRLPTEAELTSERASWASSTSDGAFASPLRWSLAGYRSPSTGNISNVGTNGFYASSTVWYEYFRNLQFSTANSAIGTYNRASGHSVRCIKN